MPKVLLPRVALMAICCLFAGSTAVAQFAGGSGTVADPYQVATPAQLDSIRNDLQSNYILIGDIDLTGYTLNPVGWLPNPYEPPAELEIDIREETVVSITDAEQAERDDRRSKWSGYAIDAPRPHLSSVEGLGDVG